MQDVNANQNEELLQLPQWQALVQHQRAVVGLHLRDLFAQDSQRFEHFSVEAAGVLLDYSKNRVTQETLQLLVGLAQARGVQEGIDALFSGENVNTTEQRAALHTLLRGAWSDSCKNASAQVEGVLERMQALVAKVWEGEQAGEIQDVVHIGIGGSDLGPRLLAKALSGYRLSKLRCHFVSHMDGKLIKRLLADLNPRSSLVLVASKSFKTKEVLCNAQIARDWLREAGGEAAVRRQMLAVTAYPERAVEFGVETDLILPIWEWVGGRFSLWSAISLSVALMIGMENFRALLAGAAAMDQHFRSAPLLANMPVILALLDVWYGNFFGAKSRVILPYEEGLADLPAHLQQLEMESNGKSIGHAGDELSYTTAPIIWGALGSNAQHAFLQLLYQGTHLIPVDFIVTADTHPIQMANCVSQAQALAFGKTLGEAEAELRRQGKNAEEVQRLAMHQTIAGNCPSNSIFMPKLTPASLGALIALYEHKVFVEGVVWGINSFDQWGIELGKQLANRLLPSLERGERIEADGSTQGLIEYYRRWKNNGV